jgi:hypothetical protein
MGTGDLDFDSKLTAALRGLTGWSGLQVVMTKVPIGLNGESLVPEGLDIKIIRYFPLADVLHAFDGAIAAAGYNSVHELLPARIPTVFIPNDRGTDNQRDRAKWTEDRGFAYFADASNLDDITRVVKRLRDASKRALLIDSCGQLSLPAGAQQASRHLLEIASAQESTSVVNVGFKGKYLFYLIRTQFSRRIRFLSYSLLRHISLCYRKFVPRHGAVEVVESEGLPVFSQSQIAKEMHPLIKSNGRYEHLIPNASPSYICRRREIAEQAFGVDVVGDLDMASEETKALILENSTR